MKHLVLNFIFFICGLSAFAQDPVNWSFSAKKLDNGSYEVCMKATIQNGWHVYAQKQPPDAIAQPIAFHFNKNPVLNLEGEVKEIGKPELFRDKVLGVSANQFSNKVDFVQVVKLKVKAKTSFSGKLEYQTCNDEKCLPPKTVAFTIPLD